MRWQWSDNYCTCDLSIPTFTPSTETFNPMGGETVTLSGSISSSSNSPTHWTLSIAGNTFSGDGNTVAVEWDGTDGNGRLVEDGLYTATLRAATEDGGCDDTATLDVRVENSCPSGLTVDFGSRANFANGNLSHEQPLPGAGITLHYNSLDSHNGPLGLGWSHVYDLALARQSDGSMLLRRGNGRRTLFRAEGTAFLSPPGEYSVLTQTSNGYTLTRKDGSQELFAPAGQLVATSDRNGNLTRFAYNSSGLLATITDADGRVTSFLYDGNGRLATIVTPAGNTYAFTMTGDTLTQVTMPDGGVWRYAYDAAGFLTSRVDPAGNRTSYAYDARHRVIASTDPQGRTRSLAYPVEGGRERMATFTEKDGSVRRFAFDSHTGNLLAREDADGNLTSTTHDANHNLTSIADQSGTVTMTYDARGNMTSRTDQQGHTTRYTYNALGQPTSITDPLGAITSLAYDARGNLLSVTDPGGGVTSYAYDQRGRLIAITDPLGHVTRLAYDALGNLANQTDPAGNTTAMTYDLAGNLLTVTDPEGRTNSLAYDPMGRMVAAQDPLGHVTRFTYDANGNQTGITDANGHVTGRAYDAMGRLTAITDPRGGITRLQYDANGNLASLTDPKGNITSLVHDPMGRLLQETDPLGRQTAMRYDGLGRLISRTDAQGNTIRYSYDAAGRLLTKTMPDNSATSFAYDAAGRLIEAAGPEIGYDLSYDAAGRLTAITDSNGRSISYRYDAAGNRVGMTLPDGRSQTYAYDEAGRLSSITSLLGAFTFAYDAAGRRTGLAYPNHIATSYQYDGAGRLVGLAALNNLGDPMAAFAYSLDAAGNRIARTSLLRNDAYTYDPADQLTQAVKQLLGPNGEVLRTQQENYSYDAVGNRESGLRPRVATEYDQANQLLSSRQFTYTYDDNGNLTSKARVRPGAATRAGQDDDEDEGLLEQVLLDPDDNAPVGLAFVQTLAGNALYSYDWDYENRLTKVTRVTPRQSVTTSFKYDPFGRRVEKRVETTNSITGRASVVTHAYLYDQEDMVAEIVTTPRPRRDRVEETIYVHGPGVDEPLGFSGPRGEYFLHADGLGSIAAITALNGGVAQRYEYSAFGVRKKYEPGVDTAYGFTGREWDQETGLYYYRARYYDPQAGRFISRDPIGFAGGDVNVYRYVLNNPVNAIDPYGLFQWVNPVTYWTGYMRGTGDMVRGRSDMMDAGTTGADAYFHCRANCEASRRGHGGHDAARSMSWLRETIQNEPPADRARDEAANTQGQCAGEGNPDADCYKACSNLIPSWGIPQRHLPSNADPSHVYHPQR
ncbi:MAG: RHS repeat-associated core domain-containing protein [Thermodesulfobacteriota bacterium]